jgi:hypothetical protein
LGVKLWAATKTAIKAITTTRESFNMITSSQVIKNTPPKNNPKIYDRKIRV